MSFNMNVKNKRKSVVNSEIKCLQIKDCKVALV